jgi:hypothetical protein
MADLKKLRSEAKGKFAALTTIVEKKDGLKNLTQKLDDDAKELGKNIGKKAQDFADKAKQKIPNYNNVFENLIGDLNKILKTEPVKGESKIRKYTRESVNETTKQIKQVVIDNVKAILFANDNEFGCGSGSKMPMDSLSIKPSEFDFLGTLKMDPASTMGNLVYEDTTSRNKTKMNKDLYQSFDSGTNYTFTSNSGNDLFTMDWDSGGQQYNLTGLQGAGITTIDQFITQYYETIEFPQPSDILKNSVSMLLAGDGSQPKEFDINMNNLNRILQKITCACGKPRKDDELQQTPKDQFNEDDVDEQMFFDTDDLDGIDLDDEALRFKRVLRFRDCNNFEVPINPNHIEDFSLLSKKNTLDAYNSILNKMAKDAYNESGGSLSIENLRISMNLMSILNLPKALLGSIFSAKIFLPLVILWKTLKAGVSSAFVSAKQLVKNFYKLFYNILHDLFFKFITIFWTKVKPELIALIISLVPKIFKTSKEKYLKVIKSLLAFLKYAIPFIGISNCAELYEQLLKLIDLLRVGISQKVPSLMLQLAKLRPGFSADRALIEVAQGLESRGITTGDFFEPGDNNLLATLEETLKGWHSEMNTNSFVQISLDPTSIPVAPAGGAALITPLVRGTGLMS